MPSFMNPDIALDGIQPRTHSVANDTVRQALTRAIDEHCIKCFDNFGIHMIVYPAPGALRVVDGLGQFIGFRHYVFEVFGQDGKSMAVCRDSHGTMRVSFLGHWTRIESFLKHVKPTVNPFEEYRVKNLDYKQGQWDQQARWWVANKKKFRFLDLPAEIRQVIYGFALGGKVEPYPTHRARRLGLHTGGILARKANSNLLKTCKLIYNEASHILFKHTTFFVEHYGVAVSVLAKTTQSSRIHSLELALSHIDFFSLFGGSFNRSGRQRSLPLAALALRGMKLGKLVIKIAPPAAITASDWLDGACQKTVVDWLFEKMWPIVGHQPVEITGFVKTKQKAAFEAACCAARQEFIAFQRETFWFYEGAGSPLRWDDWKTMVDGDAGGADLVHGGEAAGLKEVHAEEAASEVFRPGQAVIRRVTPMCMCKVPCTIEHWNPDD